MCEDEYHAAISTLTAKVDILSNDHNKLEGTVNDLSSTVDSQYSGMMNLINLSASNIYFDAYCYMLYTSNDYCHKL